MRIDIPTKAVPKARARKSAAGNWYTPETTRVFEETCRDWMRGQYKEQPLEGRLAMSIVCYGASYAPDLDNLAKAIQDAGQGILYKNDNQIDDLHITRIHNAKPPRIMIHFSQIGAR